MRTKAQVHFEWVKSEANIADFCQLGGKFDLLHEYGCTEIKLIIPPISDWLTPEETVAHISARPFGKERGANG